MPQRGKLLKRLPNKASWDESRDTFCFSWFTCLVSPRLPCSEIEIRWVSCALEAYHLAPVAVEGLVLENHPNHVHNGYPTPFFSPHPFHLQSIQCQTQPQLQQQGTTSKPKNSRGQYEWKSPPPQKKVAGFIGKKRALKTTWVWLLFFGFGTSLGGSSGLGQFSTIGMNKETHVRNGVKKKNSIYSLEV